LPKQMILQFSSKHQ